MNRGDDYWFTFQEPYKKRPVLILTRATALSFLNAVTVAPITSTIRGIPSEIYLDQEDGLNNPCVATFDTIVIPICLNNVIVSICLRVRSHERI